MLPSSARQRRPVLILSAMLAACALPWLQSAASPGRSRRESRRSSRRRRAPCSSAIAVSCLEPLPSACRICGK